MKIKGIYTIHKYAAEFVDGEWQARDLIDTIEEENDIQYKYIDKLMLNSTHMYLNFSRIFVSEIPQTGLLYANLNSATQWVVGSLEENASYTGPSFGDPGSNGFWRIRNRFTPPVATRYIRSIAAGSGTRAAGPISLVTLSVPCIQETNEILDIFYRIFIDWTPAFTGVIDTSRRVAIASSESIIASVTTTTSDGATPAARTLGYPHVLSLMQTKADLPSYRWAMSSPAWRSTSSAGPADIRFVSQSSHINAMFGHRWNSVIPGSTLSEYHGMLVKALGIGNGTTGTVYFQPVDKGTTSSIQNQFHRQANTGNFRNAFLDIDNLGTSIAEVNLTDPGTWADTVDEPFAHQFRIKITTGGLVGTAEYKFMRRRGTGWNYASHGPIGIPILTMNAASGGLFSTIDDTSNTIYGQSLLHNSTNQHNNGARFITKYKWPEFITFGPNGITVMHVQGTYENIDASSTFPLPATDILQIAAEHTGDPFDSGTGIFVACGDTGLWRITRPSKGPTTAVTQITPVGITNPNSCRGVSVNKSNGDVWALFHDVTDAVIYLAKSTDNGSTWTLYDETTDPQFLLTDYTSGTPGPSNVIGLIVSPYSVDNQIFIFSPNIVNDASTLQIGHWWSEAGSSPTSNGSRFNTGSLAADGLKFKITSPQCIVPLDNGSWLIQARAVAITGGIYYTGITSFGEAGVTANEVSSTSVRRNSVSVAGPTVLKDRDGTDVYIGTLTANPANTQELVLRDASQFSTASFRSLIYNNSSSVTTTTSSIRTAEIEGSSPMTSLVGYIGNGIFVMKESGGPFCYTSFYGDGLVETEERIPWFEEWGWNGAAWELGHAGSKVTHADDQDLIETLQINFDDHAGVDELVSGEYYDVYVYDGVLLDNATAFRQSIYTYIQGTATGIDFTPSTVPVADIGAVVSEPIALNYQGNTSARIGVSSAYAYGEPGKLIAGSTGSISTAGGVTGYLEHKLSGDFEFRFKMVDSFDSELRLGLISWSELETNPLNVATNAAAHRFNISYNRTGVNNPAGTINYSIRVNTATLNSSTTAATITKTEASENDVFAFRRVGSSITFLINDVVEYTYPTATAQDLAIVFVNSVTGSGGWTLYDGELDYTIDRRYVEVGNGVDTGAKDINFARMALEQVENLDIQIFLDAEPATILNDGITAPGPGEVNILPYSGRIWFNATDAGKTITGKWRIIKKLNLE